MGITGSLCWQGCSPTSALRQELAAQTKEWSGRNSPNFHTINFQFHPVVEYSMQEEVVRAVRPAMLVILGAVGFVLLIACVNVANLLLARAEARQKEISVRVAVGAGTLDLIREFLAEGLLISVSGALAGLGIAWLGVRLLLWAGSETIPRAAEVAMDWRVLTFTGLVLVSTAVAFRLAPLAQVLTRKTHDILKASGGDVRHNSGHSLAAQEGSFNKSCLLMCSFGASSPLSPLSFHPRPVWV